MTSLPGATAAPAPPPWEDPELLERLADYIAMLADWQQEDRVAALAHKVSACPVRQSA